MASELAAAAKRRETEALWRVVSGVLMERMYSSISPCGDVGVAGAKENDLFSSSPSSLDGEIAFVFALLL